MAVRDSLAVRVVTNANGGVGTIKPYPEKATQTFDAGELVTLDTAGRVGVCADNGQVIYGIARKDATGVTDTSIPVQLIFPGDILEMACTDTSGIAGTSYDIEVTAGTFSKVDTANVASATLGAVTIVEALTNTAGTAIAKALVTINPAVLQTVTGVKAA